MNRISEYNLEDYPQDGNHIELFVSDIDLPFEISKGTDWAYEQSPQYRNMWLVYPNNNPFHMSADYKFFKTKEKAVEYAVKEYRKYLKKQLKLLEDLDA